MLSDPLLSVIRDRMAAWLGFTHDGVRDLYQQFGWTKVIRREQLFAMYNRNGVANRIIRLYPQATWREKPIIRDERGDSAVEGKATYSPFVEAVEDLFEKHRVFHYLERADRVSSIGQFGCLLLGFNDNKPMAQPLDQGPARLLYMQPYSELNITISQIDDNPRSPRFGRPLLYTLQGGGTLGSGLTTAKRSIVAHWTRVIHLAELLDEDEVYGIPRLVPIFNYLQDLDKMLGSSTETFWLNARAGLSLEADKDASVSQAGLDKARAQAIEYEHKLRRIFALQGMKANVLEASVDDPSMTINGLMDAISAGSGIPKRILQGSERGELASSQDENNWAQRTDERRQSFAMPAVLVPLVRVLLYTENLPRPEGEWWVQWGGKALTPEQQANVGASMANTLKNYLTAPGADMIVPPSEFREKFLGLSPAPETSAEDDPLLEELRAEQERQLQLTAELKGDGEDDGEEGGEGGESKSEDNLKANTKVAPVYVYRQVLNADEIVAWAAGQGFETLLPADDLHVTILYSKGNVDWLAMGTDDWGEKDGDLIIPPGGPRLVELFGPDKKSVVLSFANNRLAWRHEDMRRKGATSDYPTYCPHITLTHSGLGDLTLEEIEPYSGRIVLGPEAFEDIEDSWADDIVEVEL